MIYKITDDLCIGNVPVALVVQSVADYQKTMKRGEAWHPHGWKEKEVHSIVVVLVTWSWKSNLTEHGRRGLNYAMLPQHDQGDCHLMEANSEEKKESNSYIRVISKTKCKSWRQYIFHMLKNTSQQFLTLKRYRSSCTVDDILPPLYLRLVMWYIAVNMAVLWYLILAAHQVHQLIHQGNC